MIPSWDKGFSDVSLIGQHDIVIKNIIKSKLKDTDAFINSTWFECDNEFQNILSCNPKRLVFYSGPDWENKLCRQKEYDKFNHDNIIFVGNTDGEYYFSFWLDFVYSNLDTFELFDNSYAVSNMKHFMCLNRKPHRHRKFLVIGLRGLMDYGYLSWGGDNPILLNQDKCVSDKSWDDGSYPIDNDVLSLGHQYNWQSHFLNVVTESVHHTKTFVSEKTLKPIIGKRPFIILGDDKIYDKLHDWGIDTFDDLFGTGYKDPNFENRIGWIYNTVHRLCQIPKEELPVMLEHLRPRLDKNYNKLREQMILNRKKIEDIIL